MKSKNLLACLSTALLMLLPLFQSNLSAQCSYQLSLDDTYGDGWNGNTIDVRVGNSTVNYTLNNGFDTTIVLAVTVGDSIKLSYNNTGLYQSEVSFELFDSQGLSVYASGQGPAAGLRLDTLATCPACPVPNPITLDSISPSTVSISWASTSASSYSLEWGPCGFTVGTGSTGSAFTNNYTITGLAPSQCIDVYITADCSGSGNGVSVQGGPYSFSSGQPVVSTFPFLANFESNNGFFSESGSNSSWQWGAPSGPVISSASSGNNAWVTNLSGDYNNSELSYLTSPTFDLSSETTDFILYFDLNYETESCCDEFWMEISTDAGITWTKLSGNGTEVNWYNDAFNDWWDGSNSGWAQSSINLNNIAGLSGVQFRFVFSTDGSVTRDGVGVDDFGLSALSCGVPTGLTATSPDDSTLIVSWTSTGTNFNIEYGVQGFSQGSGTFIYNATNPDTISGLMAGTNYDIYVQDSCGVGNVGIWAGPAVGTTQQNSVNTFPYTEDFESSQGGWISGGTNNSWQWGSPTGTTISSAAQGVNAWVTNLAGAYNNSEFSYLQSLVFDCSALTNDVEYAFSMIYNTETCCDEGWVEYTFDGVNWTKLIDNGSATGWYNDVNNQWWDDGNGTTWATRSNVIPGSAGQAYVQIRHVLSTDGSVTREGFGIDDVSLTELACTVPFSLGAANVGTFNADLFWSTSGSISIVEWGPAGFVVGTGQGNFMSTTNDTLSLTGLMANTCYDFYVQDSCLNGNSAWVGPINFCTLPTCPMPTNLGANNVDSVSATLVWDGNSVPSTYIVEYGGIGLQPGAGTVVVAAADSVTLTGLNNASDYCFYVREVCSPTDTSSWAGPFCFQTSCGAFLGDDYASPIPVTGSIVYNGNSGICYSDNLSLRSGPEVVFAYTPTSGTTAASFETCGSGYDTYLFLVDASFNTISLNDDACGVQSQLLSQSVTPGVTYYVVVETYSSFTTPGPFTLTITEVNPCPPPMNLTSTASTCTSVDLIWKSGAAANGYIVEYGAQGYMPGTGTSIVSNDTTESISGLMAGTAYDFYVSGLCVADTSAWAGPYNFTTPSTNPNPVLGAANIVNVTLTDALVDFDATSTIADSVAWDFDDGSAIQTGFNVQHLYQQNGTYEVVLSAFTDCGLDTAVINLSISTISNEEWDAAQFEVYPNPTNGVITVLFENSNSADAEIELLSLAGQVIETLTVDHTSGNRVQMDLSDLPSGVYMVRFTQNNSTSVKRIILE